MQLTLASDGTKAQCYPFRNDRSVDQCIEPHPSGNPPIAMRDDRSGLVHPEWTWLAGSVEAILTDPATGLLGAGVDPRRPAYAMAI
jgi:hypothetical protein